MTAAESAAWDELKMWLSALVDDAEPVADAMCNSGWRPPASVIPADTHPYETQTAALDALPVHTLVSYRDHDGELHTLEKTPGWRSAGDSAWWETIARNSVTTYNLVRNEVDYTIVRMGDGS